MHHFNFVNLENCFFDQENTIVTKILLILSGVFLLTFASQLSIPLQPVPITFQSATVILIGMAYGVRNGAYVVATYLCAGALGLPAFAKFSVGLPYFYGPTSGYLIGFLFAAMTSGYLAQKGFAKNFILSFIAAMVGATIIFTVGTLVLANMIGLSKAIQFGLMPFIISEPIKLLAVAWCVPKFWSKSLFK